MSVTADWYWEGNVVDAISKHLVSQGWEIISTADTHSKARGIDIHARKNGKDLLVEVKGYPSTSYRDERRAAEKKRTNPTNQAQHWYSHALLKVMRLQTEYPDALVSLGLPNFPRYRRLFDETRLGLEKLGIALLSVTDVGNVEAWGM